jgi:hypothetical protein
MTALAREAWRASRCALAAVPWIERHARGPTGSYHRCQASITGSNATAAAIPPPTEAVTSAARTLGRERLLLPADVERYIEEARNSRVLR